jgi:NAD(P)-dependent dehydrogenase (short-subunit alcohol dehydrogenase family)
LRSGRVTISEKRTNRGGGGSIVHIASIFALMGVENNGPYVASKHAMAGITKTSTEEVGNKRIFGNGVAP